MEIKTAAGLGSGVIYDTAGDIVTNAHVVGSATSFQVYLTGSVKPLPAKLTGSYPPDDLAVIKVSGAAHLAPARFADSSKLRVGDIVLAMGNPLGLASSVTDGIISAVGRTVSEPQESRSARGDAAGRDPDVGGHQPGQQRRRPGRPVRGGGRHPHARRHRPAAWRRGARDRLRHTVQHRHRYRRADRQDRARHELPPRRSRRQRADGQRVRTASPRVPASPR